MGMDSIEPSGHDAAQPPHRMILSSGESAIPGLLGEASKPGRLVPPYPFDNCANTACEKALSEDRGGAYLYRDLRSGKLAVFCDYCSRYVELNFPQTFILIGL